MQSKYQFILFNFYHKEQQFKCQFTGSMYLTIEKTLRILQIRFRRTVAYLYFTYPRALEGVLIRSEVVAMDLQLDSLLRKDKVGT
jgi:hypothetical protein